MDAEKAIATFVAILNELQQDGAAKNMDVSHVHSFIVEISGSQLTLDSFLEKLRKRLGDERLYAKACKSDHIQAILSPPSSPEHQSNALVASHERGDACEPPREEQDQGPVNDQPIIAPDTDVPPTAPETFPEADRVIEDADGAISEMVQDFSANGPDMEDPVQVAADNAPRVAPPPHLFNARDFLVKKIAEYRSDPDNWTWVDGKDSLVLKNHLVVVDENGQLLDNPEQGGWDPHQEIYIQSSQYTDFARYKKERPLLDDTHEPLYPSAPFFKAFATSANELEVDENGAGSSKTKGVKDCAYPVYTVEDSNGTDLQSRLIVMVVRKDWPSRKNNKGQDEVGGAWPNTLDGLQGKLAYLKIRRSFNSCYYYGKNYMAGSMWPTPPPRDDATEAETPAKRQRTAPCAFVPTMESIRSEKEESVFKIIPQTTVNCFTRWSLEYLTRQSAGDRDTGVFTVTENYGMFRADILAVYRMEGSDRRLHVLIECDEEHGHQNRDSKKEMERMIQLAENHSEWRSNDLFSYLRINPDVCEDFGGCMESLDYESNIEFMVEHICMQAEGIDTVKGTSELPIYYLFFPDRHKYADVPEVYPVPRNFIEVEETGLEYRLSYIRDGKVREGRSDWK